MSRVLVINSGSSSLKYQLIEIVGEQVLAAGLIERIGEVGSSAGGHTSALELMVAELRKKGIDPTERLTGIGHRVVHGGEKFREPTLITEQVKREIDELSSIAPLHNPPALAGIVAAEKMFPGVPQVAVFDTAFHQTLSPAAYTYAIDAEVAKAHGIRRFGFHGTSFRFVTAATAAFLGRPVGELKLIILHLGNGASACAVDGGRSVETSMGMTPLEGLMMGTRGGDIDPGVVLHLQRHGLSTEQTDTLLNHESGLLGLGGHVDIRDVQSNADGGDAKAQLALEVYLRRIRHYLGAYLAQLGRADAIVFTAGVGENSAFVRAGSLAGLEMLGIRVSAERNDAPGSGPRRISDDRAPIAVLVIPTNEELEIARQTAARVVQ